MVVSMLVHTHAVVCVLSVCACLPVTLEAYMMFVFVCGGGYAQVCMYICNVCDTSILNMHVDPKHAHTCRSYTCTHTSILNMHTHMRTHTTAWRSVRTVAVGAGFRILTAQHDHASVSRSVMEGVAGSGGEESESEREREERESLLGTKLHNGEEAEEEGSRRRTRADPLAS